jgi:hypothetical protein
MPKSRTHLPYTKAVSKPRRLGTLSPAYDGTPDTEFAGREQRIDRPVGHADAERDR